MGTLVSLHSYDASLFAILQVFLYGIMKHFGERSFLRAHAVRCGRVILTSVSMATELETRKYITHGVNSAPLTIGNMDWQRRVHCIRDVIGHLPHAVRSRHARNWRESCGVIDV